MKSNGSNREITTTIRLLNRRGFVTDTNRCKRALAELAAQAGRTADEIARLNAEMERNHALSRAQDHPT